MEETFIANMHVKNSRKVFVGDICYALDDNIYDKVWGEKLHYEDGVIEDENDVYAIAVGTAYGDGEYRGTDGTWYLVDAGVLGVTNMDYLRQGDSTNCGRIITIPDEFGDEVRVVVERDDNGVISISIYSSNGNYIFETNIETNIGEDDDDYDDESYDEDDDY